MTGGDSWWSKQCTLMEVMMTKLDGPDLLVPKRCDRKYCHRFFFRGLNTGGTEARAVFWHVGGGSKIKSAVTVCSVDRGKNSKYWSWSPTLAGICFWLGEHLLVRGTEAFVWGSHLLGSFLLLISL